MSGRAGRGGRTRGQGQPGADPRRPGDQPLDGMSPGEQPPAVGRRGRGYTQSPEDQGPGDAPYHEGPPGGYPPRGRPGGRGGGPRGRQQRGGGRGQDDRRWRPEDRGGARDDHRGGRRHDGPPPRGVHDEHGEPPQGRRPPARRQPEEVRTLEPATERGRPPVQQPEPAQPVQRPPGDRSSKPPGASVGAVTKQMKGLRVRERPTKTEDAEIITRPTGLPSKTGTDGMPLEVITNYCMLRSVPGSWIYQFQVSYNPNIESKSLRIALLSSHTESLNLKVRVFDGMVLYLPHPLPEETTKVISKTRGGDTVEVTIKQTNKIGAQSPTCLQLLNILFRKVLQKLGMQQIGRHYYSKKGAQPVEKHNMELWPGFITSILQYEQNLMLCLDVSHKVLRTDSVLDYLYSLQREKGRALPEVAAKALIGEIVLTRYNNRTYRVDDIDWNGTPRMEFTTSSGEKQSLVEYYRKHYEIRIKDLDQPLIVSRPRKPDVLKEEKTGVKQGPLLLIPELCTRTGLSNEARSDFNLMRDVAKFTRQGPADRLATMNRFLRDLHTNSEVRQLLGNWNVQFQERLHSCRARVLEPQKIVLKSHTLKGSADADWSRDMREKHVISFNPISSMDIVYVGHSGDSRNAVEAITNSLPKVNASLGLRFPRPQRREISNDRTDAYLRALQECINARVPLVIIVLPSNRKERYDAIKKYCIVDAEVPIASQCILARTMKKQGAAMSVTTKVALQMNCKLGGELWTMEFPGPTRNTMVIGIDTYHDSRTRFGSAAGFVSSTNATLTKYYSQCTFQLTGQELSDNLRHNTNRALKEWRDANNNRYPSWVFVYRDGVGDGQLRMVKDYELPQIKAAFGDVGIPDYKPILVLIVVKKRISTRVYRSTGRDVVNPPPGTIVDTSITRPQWYDFYLCSQSVRQGTVTPTHFNVVEITDPIKLPPNAIQMFTYKLCHMYYNWPGTVRVPAPCQYAHKLAYLLGQSVHANPKADKGMCDRLYFL